MTQLHGLPPGYPPALEPNPASSHVNPASNETRETKSETLPVPATPAKTRVSGKKLRTLATALSERDAAILVTVDAFRFVTTAQLVSFHFAAHASPASAERTCRRVLVRLRELRVLGVLEQRIGGVRAGSDGLVYYLDTVGDRVLRQENPGRTRRRMGDPSTRFLDHTLAISGIAAGLHRESRARGGEVVRLATEQGLRYADLLGASQVIRPDLSTEVATTRGSEDIAAFFVEVDLGHESIPTLIGKCLAYEEYRRSGVEQRQYGGFPIIVWAMTASREVTAQRRRDALARVMEQSPKIDPRNYRIITLQDAPHLIFTEACHE